MKSSEWYVNMAETMAKTAVTKGMSVAESQVGATVAQTYATLALAAVIEESQ